MVYKFLSLFLVGFCSFTSLTKPGVALCLTIISMDFQTSPLRNSGGHPTSLLGAALRDIPKSGCEDYSENGLYGSISFPD